LRDLETTEETAHTADTVIFEAVFTLERHCRRSKNEQAVAKARGACM
jgi:hypothetical protein